MIRILLSYNIIYKYIINIWVSCLCIYTCAYTNIYECMCIYSVIIWATSVLNNCCWHWISKYWSLVPRGNTGLDSYGPLVTFSSTYPNATSSYACFRLKTPCLIYTVDSLILNLQSFNSCLNKSYLTHVFFSAIGGLF